MPARTRRPLPWILVAAIGYRLMRGPAPSMALCWLIMVDGYLRPGEACDLSTRQILPGISGTSMRKTAIHLNPDYYKKFSKTGELDESIVLHRLWLCKAVEAWAKTRASQVRLWPFLLPDLRREFMKVTASLNLSFLSPVLYQGRHSGASLDRMENRLTLAEVQKRGRWRSSSSTNRYEKHALLQEVLLKVGIKVRARSEAEARLLPGELAMRFAGTSNRKVR